METLRDKRYLADITGMSVDYWDDQCTKRRIPFTQFGRKIKFTDEQIAEIVAMHAVTPKQVPARDEIARTRAQRRTPRTESPKRDRSPTDLGPPVRMAG